MDDKTFFHHLCIAAELEIDAAVEGTVEAWQKALDVYQNIGAVEDASECQKRINMLTKESGHMYKKVGQSEKATV